MESIDAMYNPRPDSWKLVASGDVEIVKAGPASQTSSITTPCESDRTVISIGPGACRTTFAINSPNTSSALLLSDSGVHDVRKNSTNARRDASASTASAAQNCHST
ncbi:MAG TPA: hypothetical protein VGN11_07575 [Candidatus Baltobacteraceae bacterium]|nr:hypothetical protein [Candidatus Baltobacteraceae bacterium]